ncbi:MAG: hypothetical protein ACKO3W_12365, partial [bacterium]
IDSEPAARRLAVEYVGHIATWGHMPNQQLIASDKALETFGRALADAVRVDPSLVALLPDTMGPPEAIPSAMVDPILANPDALRAFLRGPVLAVKHLPRSSFNDLRVGLVYQGVGCLKRELTFESVTLSYGRRDGTSVAFTADARRPRAPLELNPDFGTEIELAQPLADPAWDGTLRIDARVGHGPAARLGSPSPRNRMQQGKTTAPMLEGVFDHTWEVRIELIDPKDVRLVAAFEPYAVDRVSESLKLQEVTIEPFLDGSAAPGADVTFELENFGTINRMLVAFATTVEQGDRVWDVNDGARNTLDGFEPGRPFNLVLRGVLPERIKSVDNIGYLAGRWSAKFDGKRRTPTEVVFTQDPDAKDLSQETNADSSASRLGDVVPGATVGPRRPTVN